VGAQPSELAVARLGAERDRAVDRESAAAPEAASVARRERPRADLLEGVELECEPVDDLPEALEVTPHSNMPLVHVRLDGHARRDLADKRRVDESGGSVEVTPVRGLQHGHQSLPSIHGRSLPTATTLITRKGA
jgi:hypothetical protein